jgi:hypothetical protein
MNNIKQNIMDNVTSIQSKEEYIYRFLPLRYFLQLLDNRCLFFPRVSTWEDPYELFLFKQRFIDAKGIPINVFSQSEHIFGQCWTTQRDSDALWRIYSPDLMSVRIKTTKRMIESFIEQNQGNGLLIKSDMVDYQAQNQIETWLKSLSPSSINTIPLIESLFIKRNSFAHEKEFRIIIWETDFNEYGTYKSSSKYMNLPIDPQKFILEVNLDPRLSQEEVNLWKPAISLRLGSSCRVSQSRLYQIKSNTIKLL